MLLPLTVISAKLNVYGRSKPSPTKYGYKCLYGYRGITVKTQNIQPSGGVFARGRFDQTNKEFPLRLKNATGSGVPRGNPLARFLRLLALFATQNDGVAVKANSSFIFRLWN